jgi:hypothetical protein
MTAPGYNARQTGKEIILQTVTIYNTQVLDNEEWYMIGPINGWRPQSSRVITKHNSTGSVTTNRWIDVDLAEQTRCLRE